MGTKSRICVVCTCVLVLAATDFAQQCGPIDKLTASDGQVNDHFGAALAVEGSLAVVGAPDTDDLGGDSGSVYLFDLTRRSLVMEIRAEDGDGGDTFGTAVAIEGGVILVGAPKDDDNGGSGSAYLFDANTGQQFVKLLPSDGIGGEYFGGAVALAANLAFVGALLDDDRGENSGSVYVFDVTTGEQVRKLLAEDGATESFFGISLAVSGSTLLVGASRADVHGADSGAAYLFDINTLQQTAKLAPDDGAAGDQFGRHVAVEGTTALIGMYSDSHRGAAYLFDMTTGTQIAKLLPDNPDEPDGFSEAVALHGDFALVGAYLDDAHGIHTGASYQFDAKTGARMNKLTPEDVAVGAWFGAAIAARGEVVLIGSPLDYDRRQHGGSVSIYRCSPCAGTEAISKFKCKAHDVYRNTLVIKLEGGLPSDAYNVVLDNGLQSAGYLNDRGNGKAKFLVPIGSSGTISAEWGCGAVDEKPYACP